MAHDVFICHSSKDKVAADTACAVLERAGIRCWVAPRDVPAGQSWAASIIRAINDSKVMLLLFSGQTNESPQIEREVERAVHRNIPVVTFRLEDVLPTEALEYFISSNHWLDAFTPPINRHYEALATRIAVLLSDGAGSGGAAQDHEGPPRSGPAAQAGRAGIPAPMAIAGGAVLIAAMLAAALVALRPHNGLPPAAASEPPATQPAFVAETVPAAPTAAAPSSDQKSVLLSYPIHLDPNGDNWVALRSEPSTTSGVRLAKLGPEASFLVLGAPGAWSHVRTTEGREGWIDSYFVGCCRTPSAAASPPVCTVADPTPTPLNVRATPDGAIVSTLANGVSLRVLDRAAHNGKAWSQVSRGDAAAPLGWVFTDYLVCPAG